MARFLPSLAIFSGFVAMFVASPANAAQPIANAWQICAAQTAQQERQEGIPRDLLKAISLTETGRWNETKQATFAWPWTVMAQGRGRFFPTRQTALAYINELRDRGVTNIDVGCMQINLYYHGDAFASIEQALDPQANTAYAASHLKQLYQSTRSWTQAAAFYHSHKPDRARAYKLKVLKYWNEVRRPGTPSTISAASTRIDHVRMAELDRRRQARSTSSLTTTDPAQLRRSQLDTWKNGTAKNLSIGQLAALRRVKLESEQKKIFLGTNHDKTGEKFAAKRHLQLKKWRQTGYLAGSG